MRLRLRLIIPKFCLDKKHVFLGQNPSLLALFEEFSQHVQQVSFMEVVEFTDPKWIYVGQVKMQNVVTTCAGVNFLFSFNSFDFFATTSTNFGPRSSRYFAITPALLSSSPPATCSTSCLIFWLEIYS